MDGFLIFQRTILWGQYAFLTGDIRGQLLYGRRLPVNQQIVHSSQALLAVVHLFAVDNTPVVNNCCCIVVVMLLVLVGLLLMMIRCWRLIMALLLCSLSCSCCLVGFELAQVGLPRFRYTILKYCRQLKASLESKMLVSKYSFIIYYREMMVDNFCGYYDLNCT